MTTIAEQVAERMGGDGTTFYVEPQGDEPADPGAREEGQASLDTIARHRGASVDREPGRGTRYAFPDGSAIVDSGPGWDVAFPRCWCWQGGGHVEGCPEADRCSLPGCTLPVYAKGLCEAHSRRARRGSSSTAPVRARGTETLRSLSLRVPTSVYTALGDAPGAEARKILERWAARAGRVPASTEGER